MDLVFPNAGLTEQLTRILAPTLNYHLYTNNVLPTRATVLTDLTEATWSGYAAQNVLGTDFTLKGVSGNSGYAIAAPIQFSNTSGATQQTYGYFVTDSANTILLAAAQFDGPPVNIPDGASMAVVPTWGDFSQLP